VRPGNLNKVLAAARYNRPTAIPSPTKVIKSILRTPHRLYSNDPTKIAAGTHLATPPSHPQPGIEAPATAPLTKHVDFTASAREKAARDEAKAASVEPEALYPNRTSEQIKQDLCEQVKERINYARSRRMTDAAPQSRRNAPGDFTFSVGALMHFPPTSPTIRPVRSSDVNTTLGRQTSPALPTTTAAVKRKVDDMLGPVAEEDTVANKENVVGDRDANDEEDERPAKRARTGPTETEAMKPVVLVKKTSILKKTGSLKKPSGVAAPRQSRLGGLSASRLAFLAQPKKRN
jgi:hypothetical protein